MRVKNYRIMFVLNHFFPEVGAIKTEFELSECMAKKGNNVIVITTFPRSYRTPSKYLSFYRKFLKNKKVSVETIDDLVVYRFKSFLSRNDNVLQRIIEMMFIIPFFSIITLAMSILYRPDVIIVGGDLESVVSITSYLSRIFLRKKVIVILHDVTSIALKSSGLIKRDSIIFTLIQFLEKIMFVIVDKIIVHSPSNKLLVIKLGARPQKVSYVYIWVDLKKVKPIDREKKYELRKNMDMGFNYDDFIVYYGGVLSYPQGPDIITDVANIISNKGYKKIKFLIVGDGPEKAKIEKKMRDYKLNNLKLLPFQPWETHIKLLQCSDVALVLLRKGYSQPVVPSKLIEIMAAGVIPILSIPYESDARKIAVDIANAGIWVPPGDPSKLANAIISIYEMDPRKKEEIRIRARKAAEKFFDIDKNTNHYLEIIRSIIE